MSRCFVHVLCDYLKRMKGILFANTFHTMIAVNCHCLFPGVSCFLNRLIFCLVWVLVVVNGVECTGLMLSVYK